MAPWDRSSSKGDGVATKGEAGLGAEQTSNTGNRRKKIKCNKHKPMVCEG